MNPEEMKRLATPEFSAVLAADPVLDELQSQIHSRRDSIPGALDALLLSGGDRIGSLPILPLTAAKWAFLWTVDNPLVSGKRRASETDLDIFLFVLCCPDLRQLRIPLTQLPVAARDYAAATGLTPDQVAAEIRAVIANAFYPLSMLPRSGADDREEVFYDGAWLAWAGGVAAREGNLPYDRAIHELPLSLVCNLFVSWRRREGAESDKIRRPQNSEIMAKIVARTKELGKRFLEDLESSHPVAKSKERDGKQNDQ